MVGLVAVLGGVAFGFAGGEYGTRRAEVEEGTAILRGHRGEIALLRDATPEEAELAAPKDTKCDRCGSTHDLRLVMFLGRVRYAERTVCDECAEELFELFLDTGVDEDA